MASQKTRWFELQLFSACLLMLLAVSFPSYSRGTPAPKPANVPLVLRGTLGALPGKGSILKVSGKDYILSGQSNYITQTLQDKRLLNQELQLVGTTGPDGSFVVQRLYAVHSGKLYKIQYYCEVCNITYVHPGHCYCCGRETKLQEIPVDQTNP